MAPTASAKDYSCCLPQVDLCVIMCLEPGELAQLVERCDRTAEVRGSNPLLSITQAKKALSPSVFSLAPGL